MRGTERRDQILDVSEAVPAKTAFEAASAILDQQAAEHWANLGGGPLDRGEARKHLRAINKLRKILEGEKGLHKERKPAGHSSDPLVRRMRRADLLCPPGWEKGIRAKLEAAAQVSELNYVEDDAPHGLVDDQPAVDAHEARRFISELDFVAQRGANARQLYAKQGMRVVNG